MGEIFSSAHEKQGRLLRLGCVLENSDEALELAAKCLQDSRFNSREDAARALLFLERDNSVSTLLTYIEQFASRSLEKIYPILREPVIARYLFHRMCALDQIAREKGDDSEKALQEIKRISALYRDNVSGDMIFVLISSRDWKTQGPRVLEEMLMSLDRRILIEKIREYALLGDVIFLRRASQVMDLMGERGLAVELASNLPAEAWDDESQDFPPGSVAGVPDPFKNTIPPFQSGSAPSEQKSAARNTDFPPEQSEPRPPGSQFQGGGSHQVSHQTHPHQTHPHQTHPHQAHPHQAHPHQTHPPQTAGQPSQSSPQPHSSQPPNSHQNPPRQAQAAGTAQTFFAPGEIICREGDFGGSCFIIRSGRVKVVKTDARGAEIALAELGDNEIFGEMSVIAGQPRSATIIAIEPTELLVVDEANFEKVFKVNPEFSIKMLRILSERLRKSTETIRTLEDRVKALENRN
jgi:hypothetical protein